MRRITTAWAAAAAALALIGLAGCTAPDNGGESTSQESPAPAQPDGTGPDLESVPEVVAEVDGEAISRDDFLQAYTSQYAQASVQAEQTGVPLDEQALQREIAENIVNVVLLEREADRQGITASEAEVDRLAETLAAQNQLGSIEELFDLLAEQGLTEEQARGELATQVTIDAVIAAEVGEPTVTDEQLREAYDAAVAQQEASGAESEQEIPPFEDVRDQLEQQVIAEEEAAAVEQLVASLRDEVDVEFFV